MTLYTASFQATALGGNYFVVENQSPYSNLETFTYGNLATGSWGAMKASVVSPGAFAGSLAAAAVRQAVTSAAKTAALATAGAVQKSAAQLVAAAIQPMGTGIVSPDGSYLLVMFHTLGGAVAPTATVVKTTLATKAGTLVASGVKGANTFYHKLYGGLTPSGWAYPRLRGALRAVVVVAFRVLTTVAYGPAEGEVWTNDASAEVTGRGS